jgi:hypothetical protein
VIIASMRIRHARSNSLIYTRIVLADFFWRMGEVGFDRVLVKNPAGSRRHLRDVLDVYPASPTVK